MVIPSSLLMLFLQAGLIKPSKARIDREFIPDDTVLL